jgi:RecA-family ATPase
MLLYGDAKVGKSYAALQMACCLVRGQEWLGFPVPTPIPVVYVQLDTPRSLWADRVQSLRDAGHPVEGVHFADRETLNTHPFSIRNPEHFKMFSIALDQIKPGAVIVDTLREATTGADENDSTEMQEVVAQLEAAIKPSAMIFIHHARKPSNDPGAHLNLLADGRGSNYIVGRMDCICRFSHKSMRVTSRTMEEHSIKIDRLDDGTWEVAEDPIERAAEAVLLENPGASTRQLARLLSEKVDKSESSCRAWFRRFHARKAG